VRLINLGEGEKLVDLEKVIETEDAVIIAEDSAYLLSE
jgi:hypothetical protein